MSQVIAGSSTVRRQFQDKGSIPEEDDIRMPRAVSDDWPVMATCWDLGSVSAKYVTSKFLVYAYDDVFSINYFGIIMQPYWRRNGADAYELLSNATRDYEKHMKNCANFDKKLISQLINVGGLHYATVASLSYRQAFAGMKLVWNYESQSPWYFLKEISSDGDLSTVDVIFPASPILLFENPELMNLIIIPILAYANNETYVQYNLDWAPHHLGIYPVGNLFPWEQEQMPVEETGNLILMLAVAAQVNGKLSDSIYPHYWNLLISWADYLVTALPDPGNQLCTDDFEGPSPHNVNLAAKGIVALDAFAYLCQLQGNNSGYNYYHTIALNYSSYWMKYAYDKNHYRLQYDLPDSWSEKYNLLYMKVLGLNTFPQHVIQEELNYYVNYKMDKYGVPLDGRKTYAKLDWLSWSATLSYNTTQFNIIMKSIYDFANETPSRVPLSDWYDTISGKQIAFQARPVVGGVYAKMLLHNTKEKKTQLLIFT